MMANPTEVPDSKSLSILIKDHDQVFYFFGTSEKRLQATKSLELRIMKSLD